MELLDLFANPVFLFFLFSRFLEPVLIFISPKWAIILSLILDDIDGDFLETFTNIDRPTYQTYDKLMDSWWLIFIFIYILSRNLPYKKIFTTLFLYRIIGVLIMTFWFREWLLIVFPNIFEVLFELYFFFPNWFKVDWGKIKAPYPILLCSTGLVLVREYWLHVLEIDMFSLKDWVGKRGWT